ENEQDEAEGTHHRRSRGRIEDGGGAHGEDAHERAEAPRHGEAPGHRSAPEVGGEGGHDQVGEDEKHPGDAYGARDHDAEGRIEEKVPPPHPPAVPTRQRTKRRKPPPPPPASRRDRLVRGRWK